MHSADSTEKGKSQNPNKSVANNSKMPRPRSRGKRRGRDSSGMQSVCHEVCSMGEDSETPTIMSHYLVMHQYKGGGIRRSQADIETSRNSAHKEVGGRFRQDDLDVGTHTSPITRSLEGNIHNTSGEGVLPGRER